MTSSDTNQPKSPKEKRPFVTFETDKNLPTTVSRMKSESSLAKKKPQEDILQNAVVENQVATRYEIMYI